MQELSDQGERAVILMMNGMTPTVQETNFVMKRVPRPIFEIENDEERNLVPHELEQRWRHFGQRRRRYPYQLDEGHGYDEQDMIPKCVAVDRLDHAPRNRRSIRLQQILS